MKFASNLSLAASSILFAVVSLVSCAQPQDVGSDTPAKLSSDHMRIQALKRAVIANGFVRARDLAIPTDAKRRAAGELIFNSPLMSINGSISCRDCHLDQFGSTDGLPNAVGVGGNGVGAERLQSGGRIIPRNVLPFWGRGGKGFDTFFWDGKVSVANGKVVSQFGDRPPSEDPLVVAIHLPSVELREMVSDTPEVRDTLVTETVSTAEQVQGRLARRFAKDPKIGRFLAAAYGKKPADISFGDVGDALASFIRHEFRIQPTPLHRFVYGRRPITDAELAGGILFYGRGKCAGCHGGPYFSDLAFHAVAFPQVGFGKNGFGNDEGRYNVTLDPVDRFLFRTPPLYNVTRTAPYSHSGSVARLEDAIAAHFDPLRLIQFDKMSVQERSAMYARLGPASRETLPSALTDDEVRQLAAFLAMLEF